MCTMCRWLRKRRIISGNRVNNTSRTMSEKFFEAVRNGDVNAVKKILSDGQSIHAIHLDDSGNGFSALHYAALNHDVAMAELLLDAEAYVDFLNRLGFTAFYLSVMEADIAMIKLLLDRGADVNCLHDGDPALYVPISEWMKHNQEKVDDETYMTKDTAIEVTKLLLERGADVDAYMKWRDERERKEEIMNDLDNKITEKEDAGEDCESLVRSYEWYEDLEEINEELDEEIKILLMSYASTD